MMGLTSVANDRVLVEQSIPGVSSDLLQDMIIEKLKANNSSAFFIQCV